MELSPDSTIFWRWGMIRLNATIVFTWVVMAVLAVGSWLVTRRLSSDEKISRRQNLLETLVTFMNDQIRSTSSAGARTVPPFCRDPLPLHRRFQQSGNLSRIQAAYRVSFHYRCPGDLCFYCRPVLRCDAEGGLRLSETLYQAVGLHDAVRGDRRIFTEPCPGCPALREHHERHPDRGDSAQHRTPVFPHRHAGAWTPYRAYSGVYFRRFSHGIHRFRHVSTEAAGK